MWSNYNYNSENISSQSGFLSLPHIVPRLLGANKYFHRISNVSESVPMFRTFQ